MNDRHGHALDLDELPLKQSDPALLYLQTLAPGSRRSQWTAVRRISEILSDGDIKNGVYPWQTLTPEEITRLRKVLIDNLAPATGRRYLAALKAVIEYAYIQRKISADRRDRLIHRRNLVPIRGSSPPAGRAINRDEAATFLESCLADATAGAIRDAAVFSLLYCGGLRGRELINLDVKDVHLKTGKTRIHGKGAKNRDIVLPADAVRFIRKWVKVRGKEPGPLIVPLARAGGVSEFRRVAYCSLSTSIKRRAERCKLERFTPHDLRRTFVSDLLQSGERLEIVAHACGHADVKTTARYELRKAAAAERMTTNRHLPALTTPRRKA